MKLQNTDILDILMSRHGTVLIKPEDVEESRRTGSELRAEWDESVQRYRVVYHKIDEVVEPQKQAAPVPTSSGNYCICGGLMVRTGTCETCQSCGSTSGGCS